MYRSFRNFPPSGPTEYYQADPFVPRSISHQILAAVLHTDKNAQGNNLLRGGALPAPVDGFDLDGLFSVHRLKQSVQNLTVQRPGDIVMLEHKVFLMGIGFIQQKRTDHAAGGDLGKKSSASVQAS